MKPIVVDFLRRWWRAYLCVVTLLIGALALDLMAGFTFAGLLVLPLALEERREPVGVMTRLPLARRTIGMSYWCLAVMLPMLLMTGTIAIGCLLFSSSGIPFRDLVLMLLCFLAISGSVCCIFTFVPRSRVGSGPGGFLLLCLGTVWFWVIFSFLRPGFFNVTAPGQMAWLVILIGLPLTVWGFLRCERLMTGRVRRHPDRLPRHKDAQDPGDTMRHVRVSGRISIRKPGLARFGGMYMTLMRGSFLGSVLVFGIWQILWRHGDDDNFWTWIFLFGVMPSATILVGGLRLLRCLPLSTGQLALNLLLLPLSSVLAMVVALGLMQWFNLLHLMRGKDLLTFLILVAGVISIAFSFIVRLYNWALPAVIVLSAPASVFIAATKTGWPDLTWRLLGAGLMAIAYFLNRHWLRSSATYRSSAEAVPFQRS